jgi:hypothetical protein
MYQWGESVMYEIHLTRNGQEDFVFVGQTLVTLDDREWLGLTPNGWELTLYRTDNGSFVLGSVFHRNYPRGTTLYGALGFESLDSMFHYLGVDCGMPTVLLEGFKHQAVRRIQDLDCPLPPLVLAPPQVRALGDLSEFLAGLDAA